MQIDSVTVDLRKVKPVACSKSFRRLLGFRTNTGCLRSLHQHNHFQGVNFHQLAEMAELDEITAIPIMGKKLQRVGAVSKLSLDADKVFLTIRPTQKQTISKGQSATG